MSHESRVVIIAIVLAAVAVCIATASSAWAQAQRPIGCRDNHLSVLGEDEIKKHGLTAAVMAFAQIVEMPQQGETSLTESQRIITIVTNCPHEGSGIRSVKLAPTYEVPSHAAMDPLYGVYLDADALQGQTLATIREWAREELCVINNGGAEGEGPPSAILNAAKLSECKFAALQAAHATIDPEAYWRERRKPSTPDEWAAALRAGGALRKRLEDFLNK